jgi:hypothetical protein
MGGKKKKAGKGRVKRGSELAIANPDLRRQGANRQAKAKRMKQALRYAVMNPGKVLGFGVQTMMKTPRGQKVKNTFRNTTATISANLPQGFKNRVKNFSAKHKLGSKARLWGQVAGSMAKMPETYAGVALLGISVKQYQDAAAKEKGMTAQSRSQSISNDPFWRTVRPML